MMGDRPRSDSGSLVAGVVWNAAKSSRAVTATGKVIKAIHDNLDRGTFSPREFAMMMSLSPAPIQRVFLDALVLYFRALSDMSDGRLHMTEEDRLVQLDGKAIYSAIRMLDGE